MTSDLLPKCVKVGAWNYEIQRWDSKDADDARKYGETSNNQKIIRVDDSFTPQQTASTLLHEIIHAIYCRWRIEKPFDEEQIVDRLTEGLSAVWRDNPEVCFWIHERLSKPSEYRGDT